MRTTVVTIAAFIAACSSSSALKQSGPCAARSGSYFMDFVQQSGDCGPIDRTIVVLDAKTAASAAAICTNGSQTSTDLCEVIADVSCPADSTHAVEWRGKIRWAQDGSSGGGQVSVTLTSRGAAICSGVYEIVYTRQ